MEVDSGEEAVISVRCLTLSKVKEARRPVALLERFVSIPAARNPPVRPIESCHCATLGKLGMSIFIAYTVHHFLPKPFARSFLIVYLHLEEIHDEFKKVHSSVIKDQPRMYLSALLANSINFRERNSPLLINVYRRSRQTFDAINCTHDIHDIRRRSSVKS